MAIKPAALLLAFIAIVLTIAALYAIQKNLVQPSCASSILQFSNLIDGCEALIFRAGTVLLFASAAWWSTFGILHSVFSSANSSIWPRLRVGAKYSAVIVSALCILLYVLPIALIMIIFIGPIILGFFAMIIAVVAILIMQLLAYITG